jgi:hypothetical protein
MAAACKRWAGCRRRLNHGLVQHRKLFGRKFSFLVSYNTVRSGLRFLKASLVPLKAVAWFIGDDRFSWNKWIIA